MTEMLPYRPGMTLGRTYNLRNDAIGRDIFPEECTDNPHTEECPSTDIKYHVIKSCSDVKNVLNVSGDISLKVKAGIMKIQGMGSYLTENRSEENAVEILAVAHVERVSTTLRNPQPAKNWNTNTKSTHYIRSIIYGGDLVISIRIIASDSKQKEEIEANVSAGLQVKGILDAQGKANFRKMEQELKMSAQIKFSYYGTTQDIELPRDVDSMLKALDDFQTQVEKINKGKGAPLRCELVPLSDLDPDFPEFVRQKGLETHLTEFEEMYDDTWQAKCMLKKNLEHTVEHMNKEQLGKGEKIEKRIQTVMSRFNQVISTLDVTTTGDQIQHALDYYMQHKIFGGFKNEVHMFFKDVQPHISTCAYGTPIKDLPLGQPLSILLVGMTGNGKSETANSIFGEPRFHSHMGSESVSTRCQMEIGIVGGREVCLVDTPGSIYLRSSEETYKTFDTAMAYRPQGFHALLFVFRIDVRIREGDRLAFRRLKMKFGNDILVKYGVVIFTHGDNFKRNMKKHNRKTSFSEHIHTQGGDIESVLKECNYRSVIIDNFEDDPGILRDQVIEIVTMIDELVAKNNATTYKWNRRT